MEAILLGHTKKPPQPGRRWRLKPAPDAVERGFWRGANPLQLAWGGKLGLEIRVVAPQTGELLATGTIPRAAINTEGNNTRSVRMRLGELGIRYRIAPTQWCP